MLSYTGEDGHEEMHVFFTMGWFDAGAWPWAHYLHEWATKGIFMVRTPFCLFSWPPTQVAFLRIPVHIILVCIQIMPVFHVQPEQPLTCNIPSP